MKKALIIIGLFSLVAFLCAYWLVQDQAKKAKPAISSARGDISEGSKKKKVRIRPEDSEKPIPKINKKYEKNMLIKH